MAWFSRMKKKVLARRAAMEDIARQMNMQFQPKETFSSVPLLKDFYLFRTNHKKGITNILSSSDENDEEHYKIFDYKYVIQAGNAPVVFQQTVLFIESKHFNLPKFHFHPRNKSVRWFYQIEFRSRKKHTPKERFRQNYTLRKANMEDSRMKYIMHNAFLEIVNQNDWVHVEGNNFHFVIYYHNKLLDEQGVKKLLETGMQFIQHIKEHLH